MFRVIISSPKTNRSNRSLDDPDGGVVLLRAAVDLLKTLDTERLVCLKFLASRVVNLDETIDPAGESLELLLESVACLYMRVGSVGRSARGERASASPHLGRLTGG